MPKIAWSWSRWEKFDQCPKLFHGLNITKEVVMDSNAPPLVKGREYHDTLKDTMLVMLKGEQPEFPEHLAHVEPLQRKLYEAPNFSKIFVEQQLAFTEDMQRVGWFNRKPPVWLRVGLDLIAIDPEARYALIIDYKTGKVRHVERECSQLALFAVGAFAAYDEIDTIRTAYLWLEHNKKTEHTYTRDEYPDMLHEFGEKSELIQICNQSGNWPAKQNPRCRWCPAPFGWCEFKE